MCMKNVIFVYLNNVFVNVVDVALYVVYSLRILPRRIKCQHHKASLNGTHLL